MSTAGPGVTDVAYGCVACSFRVFFAVHVLGWDLQAELLALRKEGKGGASDSDDDEDGEACWCV